MRYIPTFESFINETYNPNKQSWEQGDDWDPIFKEYNDYTKRMVNRSMLSVESWLVDLGYYDLGDSTLSAYRKYRSNSRSFYFSFVKWVREKNIPAPKIKENPKFKIGDSVSGTTVSGNDVAGEVVHNIGNDFITVKTGHNIYRVKVSSAKIIK